MSLDRPTLEKGLVQIYTGNGKGKTTAALGLALRASGHGFRVSVIQFMKGSAYYGELFAVQRLYPYIQIKQYGRNCPHDSLIRQGEKKCTGCGRCFVDKGMASEEDKERAGLALREGERAMRSGDFDLVILDEVINAVVFELLTVDEVLTVLDGKPPLVELVLTGRNCPAELLARAQLVTEMKDLKHPFTEGEPSRRGIEY